MEHPRPLQVCTNVCIIFAHTGAGVIRVLIGKLWGFIHALVYCPQEDTFAGFSQLLPDRLVLRASNVRGLAVLQDSTCSLS